MNATVQPRCRGGAATLPVGRRCAGAAIRTAAQQRGPTTALPVGRRCAGAAIRTAAQQRGPTTTLPVGRRCVGAAIRTAAQQRGPTAALPVGRRCAGAATATAAQQRGPTAALPVGRRCAGAAAFTLIELLASITILLIVVSIMATIFTESDRAWRVGTGRADSNTEGRAAINAIAEDLQYAIADDVITFIMRPDLPGTRPATEGTTLSYGATNSEICFVSLREDAGTGTRSTTEVYYWVRETLTDDNATGGKPMGRYELMRTVSNTFSSNSPPSQVLSGDYHAYDSRNWYMLPGNKGGRNNSGGRAVVAENITALAFFAPSNNVMTRSYSSAANNNRLPEYVDVMLELLSDEDAQRAAQLKSRGLPAELGTFVDKNSRRYVTRVYFQNRSGYRKR